MGIHAEAQQEHRNTSEYAAGFQDKKNVPDKVKSAMKSRMKRYFGHIEYDELTDLREVRNCRVENEFATAFIASFEGTDYSDHSFLGSGDYEASRRRTLFSRLQSAVH